DVGGGYPELTGTLSKVSLEWMLREAGVCGLKINEKKRQHIMNSPPTHPPANELGAINESLTKFWHLFELIPRRSYSAMLGRKSWKSPNFWTRRSIGSVVPWVPKPTLHQSVINRMKQGDYSIPNIPAEFEVES
ncbi:MAG: hypothetical protein QM501_04900, partial [Gimesia sp.]